MKAGRFFLYFFAIALCALAVFPRWVVVSSPSSPSDYSVSEVSNISYILHHPNIQFGISKKNLAQLHKQPAPAVILASN